MVRKGSRVQVPIVAPQNFIIAPSFHTEAFCFSLTLRLASYAAKSAKAVA